MLSRCVASFLVLLVALPFTAPFSSCDAAMLFAPVPNAARAIVWSSAGTHTAMTAARAESDSGSVLKEEQLKGAVLAVADRVSAPSVETSEVPLVVVRPVALRSQLVALRL